MRGATAGQLPLNLSHQRDHLKYAWLRMDHVQLLSRKTQRIRRKVRACATASAPALEDLEQEVDRAQPSTSGRDRSHDTDYLVIGSGIGGEPRMMHVRRQDS